MSTHLFSYTEDVERIPFRKIVAICDEDGPTVRYACPDYLWQEHHAAWVRARRNGNKTAPEPMPEGHCMFENPTGYACVEYHDRSEALKRALQRKPR